VTVGRIEDFTDGAIGKPIDIFCGILTTYSKSIDKRNCGGCGKRLRSVLADGSRPLPGPARAKDSKDPLTKCDDCWYATEAASP